MDEMPQNLSTVTAYNILQQDFSAGQVDPLEVAIRGDIRSQAVTNAIAEFRATAAADGNIASVGELQTNEAGRVGLIQVVLGEDASGDAANHSVNGSAIWQVIRSPGRAPRSSAPCGCQPRLRRHVREVPALRHRLRADAQLRPPYYGFLPFDRHPG